MWRIGQFMVLWFAVSMVFWVVYWLYSGAMLPFVLYYPLWLGVVGTLVWIYRAQLRSRLRNWRAPALAKFLLLGYGAVLSEEVFAAFANHVPEGFSFLLFLERIGQFWNINVLIFSGFICGWYVLNRYFAFTMREVFWLAGIWGLYAEKTVFAITSNPLFFVFDFSPTVLTYGLIIAPAMLSQPARPNRWQLHPLLRYPLAYAVIVLFSLPMIGVLIMLRQRFPAFFPPNSMVSL